MMLKEILEAKDHPAVTGLNTHIDKLIKNKDSKALDILAQELGKILKDLKK